MKFRVYLPSDIPEAGKAYLHENDCEVICGSSPGEAATIKEAAGCDAILVRTAPVTRGVMEAIPSLRAIGKAGVGLDNIDTAAANELGIFVTFAPESNINAVAEHTVMLMLAAAKRVLWLDRRTRAGDFAARDRIKGSDLQGKTLGLVGIGRIGRLVGKKAADGLGMKVICYDPFLPDAQLPAYAARVRSIEELFSFSDVVSLHLPSTPENNGMVSRRLLSMMKPDAVLVNCSRGEIVNEKDLFEILRSNGIAGAAIDVFGQEPPAADNPLFSLDNIVVSPHCAALTKETSDRMGLHAAMGIVDVLKSVPPAWPVVTPRKPRQPIGE